jgi:hypothetical protein
MPWRRIVRLCARAFRAKTAATQHVECETRKANNPFWVNPRGAQHDATSTVRRWSRTIMTKRKASSSTAAAVKQSVLQERLLTGLGVPGGARGSLTKLASSVFLAVGSGSGSGNVSAATKAAALRDVRLHQLEMTKLLLTVQRTDRDLAAARQEKTHDTSKDGRPSVSDLKRQLQNVRQCCAAEREYEAVASVVLQKHVRSKKSLSREIAKLKKELAGKRKQLAAAKATVQLRTAQFHLLQRSLHDMQQSLQGEEPFDKEELAEIEKKAAIVEKQEKEEHQKKKQADDDAMQVEPSQSKSEDEEGELYDDL